MNLFQKLKKQYEDKNNIPYKELKGRVILNSLEIRRLKKELILLRKQTLLFAQELKNKGRT